MKTTNRSVWLQRLFIFFWIVVFVNYGNYGYAMIVVLFPLLLCQTFIVRYVDIKTIILFTFFLIYTFFARINTDYVEIENIMKYNCFPVLAYLSGRYIARSNQSTYVISKVIFAFVASYSIIAIISVLFEIRTNGFVGVLYRDMPMIGRPGIEFPATFLGGSMSLAIMSIGIIFAETRIKGEQLLKFGFFLLALLALFCILRLGSRTGLVLMILGVLSAILFNFKHYSAKKKSVIILICAFVVVAVLNYVSNNEEVFAFYMSRAESDEYGASTGGGRTQLWTYFVSKIPNYPFGGIPQSLKLNSPYAHNLWIDIARVSGIIPFTLFLFFTLLTLKDIYCFVKNKLIDRYFRTIVLILMLGIFAQFFVEPIIEGIFMLFVFFCMLIGIITEYNKKKNISVN